MFTSILASVLALTAPQIVADPPVPDALAKGVVIVQFRSNVRIGQAIGDVPPNTAHLHVTVDDNTWHWAHTSTDPVIVAPLPPGSHKILIELADANHKVLAAETVKFVVPDQDKEFLTKVVPAIAASVKVIDYAAKNASDAKVRDFAEQVAKQHKESVDTASGHAKRLNIAVVSDADKDSEATIEKLSKLKATDLDVAFLEWLSHSHANTAVFDDEVKNGADADLKAYAKASITAGNGHLKEARELLVEFKK